MDLREEAKSEPQKYDWLRIRPKEEDAASERRTLAGSIRRDIALWFSLASIVAAWLPGPVTHRDALHAYAIVILWIVLHHSCRRATTWCPRYATKNNEKSGEKLCLICNNIVRNSYFVTLMFPSTALMPMEYCLPLMDTFDFVDDLELVDSYRQYVVERTGVQLTILS